MISIKGLTVIFSAGTPDEHRVLDDLDLEVESQEHIALIGSNGAGKTTLLNAIAGTVPAAEGSISIDGLDRTAEPEWKRARYVGRVRQDPLAGTAGDMSVIDNLCIASRKGPRRLLPASTRRSREEMRAALAELGMGLEQRLDENVNRLSGGQRQALTLLMAAVSKPSVLLLDEHTAALDPRNAEKVMELTGRFAERYGLTLISVTHDMKRALSGSTRLIMMHEGRIVADLKGMEKEKLDVADLVELFSRARHESWAQDDVLLAQ